MPTIPLQARLGRRPPLPLAIAVARSWQGTLARWAALAALMGFAVPAKADEASQSPASVSASYTAEDLTVAEGGIRRGSAFRGLAEACLQVDLSRLGAGAGSKLSMSVLDPSGDDVSADYAGDLQGASNITTYNHILLYELSLSGSFADGRVKVKAGRLLADCDFAVTDSSSALLNSSFGWPTFISANTLNTGPAFDRSALGLYAQIEFSRGYALRVGVYDGDTFDSTSGDPSRHPDGLNFKLSRSQGAFAIAELDVTRPSAPGSDPTGVLKIGVWAHSASFRDQCTTGKCHRGNGGVYAAGELPLWSKAVPGGPAVQSLTAFGRAGASPSDRDRVSLAVEAGLCAKGLVRGRGDDLLSLGAGFAGISSYAREAAKLSGAAALASHELAVEANYEASIGGHLMVVPDVQWIRHPGAVSGRRDVLLYGLRTQVSF